MVGGGMRPGSKPAAAVIFVVSAIAIVGGLFAAGLLPRIAGQHELKKAYEETEGAIPVVRTIVARPAAHRESMVLPGNIGAIQYTTVYARVDGYLKSRFVDIGDQVKAGQLLAVIDTPTIDEQLAAARSDYAKAKAQELSSEAQLKQSIAQEKSARAEVEKAAANVAYSTVTARRWENLCARGAVSEQSRDEKVRLLGTTTAELEAQKSNDVAAQAQVKAATSNVAAARAQVLAALAEVRRLEAQQSFQKVVAPFDGIITVRRVDPGALITQGSQSANLELFQIAKIDRLRVYVSVPQRVARYLREGMPAEVLSPEFPDRQFRGTVTNVSGALDPNTRTRQTEIKVDNPDHELLPGMYAEVRITGLREAPWIRVTGTCLVARADGQFVVVVRDGKAHYQAIEIGRDFGDEVEVKSGLAGGEELVVNPSDDIREGEPLKPVRITADDAT